MGLNYQQARFIASYGTLAQLPPSTTPEVAFCGRSNVGKSSLLNTLLKRKSLAKVSATPGKTANINFFDVDGVSFVDLPGYGFARVSQAEKQRWADLLAGYFEDDRSFNLVVALVDIRHEMQELDFQMVSYLKQMQLPFIVVLTKADKLSRNKQQAQRARLAKSLGVDPMACVITSSETGLGIDQVRSFIEKAVQ